MKLRRILCWIIGHDYTIFYRCQRCQPRKGDR
jgi:hypothetical protein